MSYRSRNQTLLAKVQADETIEETPTVGANAIKVRYPLGFAANFESIETDYVTGSLSRSAPQTGGGNVALAPRCYMKGAGTAGQAPEAGVLYRGCGMSETLTAAAVTGTATAGAASSITLAVGASAVDQAYRGMVIEITGGTGSGQRRVIKAYVGSTRVATVFPAWDTTPDATSQYAIAANALYRPVSTGLEVLTLWAYQHRNSGNSRLKRIKSAAGSFSIAVPVRGLVDQSFNFVGQLPAAPADVTHPGAATYQPAEPRPFINAQAYLGAAKVKFSECSIDLGAEVGQADDPEALYGYDIAGLTARAPSGRIMANLALNSVRDAFGDWLAGTARDLWLCWGPASGQRCSIYLPGIRYSGNEEGDVRGFAAEGLPFTARGEDAEAFLCFF